jgi:hypothetical protein
MSILDTYDDFNFTIILLFLYIFLFAFMVIIINNRKNRIMYEQQFESKTVKGNRSNNTQKKDCIPSPTLIGSIMQMSTCPT